MLSAIRRKLRFFLEAQRGAAAVEFTLVVPLMLLLYIASLELSQAITVDRRVTTVVGTVGDLVARSKDNITSCDLTDYFTAAQSIMRPFSATGLEQVITQLQVDEDGVATVKWSVGFNGGTAHVVGDPFPITDVPEMANIAKDSYLIVAESSYSYLPLLGLFFKTAFPLYHRNYYLPRFGDKIEYNVVTCST
jgi:Flp pilus assembly protein TadG